VPTERAVEPSETLVEFRHGLGGEVDVVALRADGSRGGIEYVAEIDEDLVEVMLVPGVAVKLVATLTDDPAPEERPGQWRVADDEEKFMASMSRMPAPPPPGGVY
jgi:hypothetical protein